MAKLPNIHPGEILYEDFMQPMGLSKDALAKQMDVPATRIGKVTLGRCPITADTDLHLAEVLGTSEGYWLRLQNAYDLEEARRHQVA
ncbi:HigA family addiction module antitoxin [Halomonas sp. Mc5H-6]|uniref:HigA family addiction module antitoxin n=1 Tax=Halomonas sp. Mc5H-6 TaxID=2954500 RepID=UPI002096E4DD|nr:HigA family addiction module antitoxin [Halomonas sp. Mc5H-6]MCO7246034.1 HigA family addiction module antitoxin [Halomonas sp. Mc5H-6]